MKKLVIGCMALAWLALVGVGVDAGFSPSLTPAAASSDGPINLANIVLKQELGLSQREYAQLSKKGQKQAKKNLLGQLQSLLASGFDGTVTKKFAKSYFDALYGKPGQAIQPVGPA